MTTKEEVRNSEDKILTDRSPESPMISIEDDDDEELDEYSCQEAMDHAKFGKWQMRLFWLTGLAWTADAMEMMILSFLGPALLCNMGLTPEEEAYLTSAVFAGMILGALAWGSLADQIGRRKSYLIVVLTIFVFSVLSAVAPTYYWVIGFRFFAGFGMGGIVVAFSLFSEFLPVQRRGFWMLAIEYFWTVGTLVEAAIAWTTLPTIGWRWMLIFSTLPLLAAIALFFVLPESPRFLVVKGRRDEAEAIIKKMWSVNGVEPLKGRLAREAVIAASKQKGAQAFFRGLKTLFGSKLRRTTILLYIMWIANAFVYYGVVIFTAELQRESSGGHDIVNNTAPSLNKSCSVKNESYVGLEILPLPNEDFLEILITSAAEVPGLFLSSIIVDKLGRKYTQFIEFLIVGIFFFLLIIPFVLGREGEAWKEVLETIFLFVSRAFIFGAFAVTYIYTPEVYPTSVRTMGVGFANSLARIGGVLCPLVGATLIEHGLKIWATSIFGGVALIAALAAVLLPLETSGVAMEDTLKDIPSGAKISTDDEGSTSLEGELSERV